MHEDDRRAIDDVSMALDGMRSAALRATAVASKLTALPAAHRWREELFPSAVQIETDVISLANVVTSTLDRIVKAAEQAQPLSASELLIAVDHLRSRFQKCTKAVARLDDALRLTVGEAADELSHLLERLADTSAQLGTALAEAERSLTTALFGTSHSDVRETVQAWQALHDRVSRQRLL
ncbi:hypothetical protein [Streptomyces wuyuanensis]|uniref:hypothetical protein n=1 Tax=Streptomyces wuyuanensis TaxID=1196353 RepID=UPI00342A4840